MLIIESLKGVYCLMITNNVISAHKYKGIHLDFIGIGCRRCASSWLHECLNEHPEVGKPPRGLHYFSNQLDKGIDWYLDCFRDFSNKPCVGEFSVSYTYPDKYARAAEKIYESFPHVKLFMVVRNPIDRAHSDYRRSVQMLEISKDTTFRKAIEQNPIFLERGCYASFLKRYLDFFPKERILVLFYEDLLADPKGYLRTLFSFLGVNPNFEPSILRKPKGHASMIRSEAISKLLSQGGDLFKWIFNHLHMDILVDIIRLTGIWRRILELNKKEQRLDKENHLIIMKYYEHEIKELERLTGRNLSYWA